MYYFEVFLLVAFVILTIVGYKKNNRNLMLAGSFCLLIGLIAAPFSKGFNEGYDSSKTELLEGKD
jgi:succinate-acetate transporter protein